MFDNINGGIEAAALLKRASRNAIELDQKIIIAIRIFDIRRLPCSSPKLLTFTYIGPALPDADAHDNEFSGV
jgi:hypothetical protein